jgi:polyhydroxybutyrate depolymerase
MKTIHIIPFLIITIALSACTTAESVPTPTSTQAPTQTSTLIPTATPAPTPTQLFQPVATERTVMVNDLERSYLLHTPPDLNNQQPVPVVFAFHGYSITPKGMQYTTRMDEIADRENFLVVYPLGIEYSWNTGWEGYHGGYSLKHNVDEPAFIQQILSDLETFNNIDPKRIYAMGHSQGGMLTYRLGCEMSDTFAAIAPVAGVHLLSDCNPTRAVSVIHFHGLADSTILFSGGGNFDFPSVENGIDTWVELNQCTSSTLEEDETKGITHFTYAPCQAGTAVELYTIATEGHDWPRKKLPASEIIWEFFVAHPMP